jgi:hypothetical protein
MRRLAVFLGLLALLPLPGSGAPRAASAGPDPVCNGGPCGDWSRNNVTVTWNAPAGASLQSCQFDTVTADTAGTNLSCTAFYAGPPVQTVTTTVTIKKDSTPPTVTSASAARGADGGGWYTSPVGVSFSGSDGLSGISGCTSTTYGGPDSAGATVTGSCTDNAGNVSGALSFSLKYDGSGPSIDASAARGPDGDGWYRSPVSFNASGSDGASGLAGCSGASYGGPDTSGTSVTVSCRDNAGNTSSRSMQLRYDATPPEVTGAAADRGPDNGDWYTKPVTVTFAGGDSLSGLAACTAGPYSGPDKDPATVSGTCQDKAGNTSAARPFTFRFDATPPKLTKTEVKKGDRFVTLTWASTGGASASEVARTDGAAEPTVVYKGSGSSFTDKSVKNGVKYRYTVAVSDAAGNADRATLAALPRPALYQPARGARIRGTATFAWEKSAKATYYNFQLHRLVRGRWVKVLTRWPGHPFFHLSRRWTAADGTTERLTAGKYRWYVWPGLGKRSARRYGKLEGSSDFVVPR